MLASRISGGAATEKSLVEAVPENKARNIYITTGDFAGYRKKLAAAAAVAAVKPAAPQQGTAGRIAPKVEESMPAVDSAKDQVKVGKADLAGKQGSDADRLAKDKALLEAQQRVSILEKNVDELQKLLELKNAKLAEEDGSDLSVDMPGQGVSPSKLREYELGNENQPSKLQESDFDETPALPDKGSFENDRNLKSKSRKDKLMKPACLDSSRAR